MLEQKPETREMERECGRDSNASLLAVVVPSQRCHTQPPPIKKRPSIRDNR
jgi:hypothetical protein